MDKREAVRVPVRVRAQCRYSGMVIDGLVEDMSRSGLFLTTSKAIRPGTSAEIELDLPGEETLHLVVEVVRVTRGGMGLRFIDEREPSRPLANFIMRQHQSFR
jgi:hypothetical protein